jgi:hypothetical protein
MPTSSSSLVLVLVLLSLSMAGRRTAGDSCKASPLYLPLPEELMVAAAPGRRRPPPPRHYHPAAAGCGSQAHFCPLLSALSKAICAAVCAARAACIHISAWLPCKWPRHWRTLPVKKDRAPVPKQTNSLVQRRAVVTAVATAVCLVRDTVVCCHRRPGWLVLRLARAEPACARWLLDPRGRCLGGRAGPGTHEVVDGVEVGPSVVPLVRVVVVLLWVRRFTVAASAFLSNPEN